MLWRPTVLGGEGKTDRRFETLLYQCGAQQSCGAGSKVAERAYNLQSAHKKRLGRRSDPYGTRTRVAGVKGRSPRPLDEGAGSFFPVRFGGVNLIGDSSVRQGLIEN